MPDGYAHKYNAQRAMKLAGYKPRNYRTFILGCNGPDPFFFYQMYKSGRNKSVNNIGIRMHNEKPGLFLQNLFRFAKTNAQKDFCLGFLCHYSLDCTMHPYINYITSAYGHPFNIENGHGFFESSLDSHLSHHEVGEAAAHPNAYVPEVKKMYFDQIITLVKQAVEATYTDICFDRSEYVKVYTDFRKVKLLLYSPNRTKTPFCHLAEMVLKHPKGFVTCHMQPCTMPIENIAIWRNPMGFFCTSTIEELMEKAEHQSADYIKAGLEYFNGVYSLQDLLEEIGNRSYSTGTAADS